MRAYLQRATQYNNFMEQQTHEYNVGKRHLANMMGVDPETFTQTDIDEAIDYLFPSGLYDPKARPLMKPPSEVFPPKKDAEFDESGRPFHVFFYTGKPNFYLILHNIATKLSELNKFEDSLRKNNILPDPDKKLTSLGSQWLSKEDLEKLTVEKLSDHEYKNFVIAIERLLKHPCSYKFVEFISNYQKPMISTKAIIESAPVEYTKDGRAYITVKDCPRKDARADVTVYYPGTGKLSINGKGIEFFDDIQAREQILFPLLFTDMVDKVDVHATVKGGGVSGKAGAIRFGISWSLRSFVDPFRGYGAVHISALNGCVYCLKWLLNNGCEPNCSVDDMTALHFATFTDSVDAFNTLIEHGCRLESTVLHSAVKSRAVGCIKLLLFKYNVDVNMLDSMGLAPIHICADQGFSDCMYMLLSSDKTLINQKDYHECTALHMACESAHVECVKLLIEHQANIHAKNMKFQVPLHMAAKAQSVDCIDFLIKAGADVNARDIDDRTPLHSAISVKTLNVCLAVDTLLSYHAKINVQDHFGFTPLHIAAINEVPECVESLLAKGGNVGIQTFGGISALNMIVRKVPSCVPAVAKQLDSAVTSNWADGFKRGPEIQLRFKYLLNSNTFGEIDLLKCFQEEGQYELLQHPLCQAFLFLKWKKIRKYYLMRLASLGFFILLYTLYVTTVLSHDCYNAIHLSNQSNSSCFQNNSTLSEFLIKNYQIMDVIIYALYLISVIEGFLKISEMAGYMYVHQYVLSLSNLSEWLVLISVPLISFHISGYTSYWQNYIGAFCVLCAWTNFMVKIGQLPWFDTYVAMYTKVQKEFAKLLMAYICLLIGFSVSLCVVFPSSKWFNNPIIGFVKVLVMMAGELDISMLEVHDESPIISKFSAYIVYVALLIFVSIILMNLLVGIAVHDIQGLKKTAGLSKVRCQIKLIYYIELFMLRSFWPKSVKRRALVYPSKHRAHMTVKPLSQQQTLPRDIIDAIRILIKRKKQDNCDNNDIFKIQEILKEVRDLRAVVEENQKVIKHLLINANKI